MYLLLKNGDVHLPCLVFLCFSGGLQSCLFNMNLSPVKVWWWKLMNLQAFCWWKMSQLSTLPETSISHLPGSHPKRKGWSSNHQFSSAFAVSFSEGNIGRVKNPLARSKKLQTFSLILLCGLVLLLGGNKKKLESTLKKHIWSRFDSYHFVGEATVFRPRIFFRKICVLAVKPSSKRTCPLKYPHVQ